MLLAAPPSALQEHVCTFWALQGSVDGLYSGLPKPYVELIISLSGTHNWQEAPGAPIHTYTKGWLTPLQFGPRYAETIGAINLIGARLKLETARHLFDGKVLLDSTIPIPIENLIGREAELLRERLFEQTDDHRRMKVMAQWITQRLQDMPRLELPSSDLIASMGWRTDALAGYFDLSPRGLRKRFKSQFGIGPKLWLQLNRFDHIVSSTSGHASLADMAAAYGYTDQAHMSHEFKRFSGRALGNYLNHRQARSVPEDAPHFVPGD